MKGVSQLSRDELLYLVMVAHRAGRMAFVDGSGVAVVTPIHRPTEEGVEYACIRIDHVDSMVDLQSLLASHFDEVRPSSTDTTENTSPIARFGVA